MSCVVTLWACVPAGAANLVFNGSFEDLNSQWSDSGANYMTLSAGSNLIAGWTVTAVTAGSIVWGQATTADSHLAPDGRFFLDLSGYGSSAVGGVQQNLTLNAGSVYDFSMDLFGPLPGITVGGTGISSILLSPFQVGLDTWVRMTGTFTADSSNSLLTITNLDPGIEIYFIDNVTITESTTPEPGTVLLLLSGLAVFSRKRR